jgi:NAD+ synthase (glutamine-hydrolysing)
MILGLLQLNSTIGDFAANREKLLAAYAQAVARGAEFVLAPELFLCGYPPRDLLLRDDFVEANLLAVTDTARQIGPVPLCLGYVERNADRPGRALRNAAAVLQHGRLLWRTAKSLLPTYDVFDEDRYFEPAKAVEPFGFNGIKIGLTICEDIWNDEDFWPERLYRRDPVRELIGQGAEFILNLSASPWCDGKERTRLEMLRRVARDERIPLAQVNAVGANDELIFDGHSVALDAGGEVLALARGFVEEVLVVELTPGGRLRKDSRVEPLDCSSRREEALIEIHEAKLEPPHVGCYEVQGAPPRPKAARCSHESGELVARASSPAGSGGVSPRESTARAEPRSETLRELAAGTAAAHLFPAREQLLFSALSLGVRDYVRKCGFKSVILGLSGGIDSALIAVIAADALGAENVFGVSLPARYSSQGSLTDAEKLARRLGLRYEVLPIEPVFQAVEAQLRPVFAGTQPNEAEENIQSRLRGVTLMALSNKFGGLVLTTGNKSEMAVGYCTLYGDMDGALAPIADVLKTDVYRLARWVNRERELIPADSIAKPPSAELRPNQTDQDSLPPYEVLDVILDLYIVRNLGKAELIARGLDAGVVNDVVNKINFSEYKRRQAAPGLRVSPRAFGMGRRIPVAQRFRTKI